ncbi:ArsR/SmtB family transcription factor [Candidatus Margulisiibacteriota bacterium]
MLITSMDELRKVRRFLKAFAEGNRLRILYLLHHQRLNVAELRQLLGTTQSNISKHLTQLRLMGLASDIRQGQFIYYHLTKPRNVFYQDMISSIIRSLSVTEECKNDLKKLAKIEQAKIEQGVKKKK